MTAKRPSISAFFPAYNDGGTIGSLVVTTLNTLAELTDDYEVIVVENGSTDYTVEVLEELEKQYSHFRALTHREALGYGGALRVGFATCRNDLIFYTDGDAQYRASELTRCIDAVAPGIDFVQGYKLGRGDPWYRKLIGRPPSAREEELALSYVKRGSWASYLQVLLCTNEFIYVD